MLPQLIAMATLACSPSTTSATDLGWLAGTWRTENEDGYSQGTFGPQYQGRISGVLTVVSRGKTILMEAISIEAASSEILMRVRHLSSELEPSQPTPLKFKLIEVCAQKAVFENTLGADASPQRSTYSIDGEGNLQVLIEGMKTAGGSSRSYRSKLTRVE